MKNFKVGFTLAEVIIVVSILGIIAALTITSLTNNTLGSQNKVKLKKAMATYDKAFNRIVTENEINSDSAVSRLNTPNCTNTSGYFKKAKENIENNNDCIFRTSDGIWWNITDIQRPVIFLGKKEFPSADINLWAKTYNNLEENELISYTMVGRIDKNGAVRVNDLNYETNNPFNNSDFQVAKLYGILGVKTNVGRNYCDCSGNNCCATDCLKSFCLENNNNIRAQGNVWTVFGGTNYNNKNCNGNYVLYNEDRSSKTSFQLYDDGSAVWGGKYYGIVDGNLTMGVNMGSPNISDLKWDKDGNLIEAYSWSILKGTCTKASCPVSPKIPNPVNAPACQNGQNCHFDYSSNEWKPGVDDNDNTEKNRMAWQLIFENYQNAVNK